MTNLTSLEVSKLTAVITGGGYKRAASKEAAVAKFLKTAELAGMTDVERLLGDEFDFDTARHVLVERKKGGYASIPEVQADASLTEASQTIDTRVGDHGAEPMSDEELGITYGDKMLAAGKTPETSEGEFGFWQQTEDGPVWHSVEYTPANDVTPIPDAEIFNDAPAPKKVRAQKVGQLIGRVSVTDALNGNLFGGRTAKIAAVAGEPTPAPAPKADKAESKTAMLLRLAQTPEGITNAKMKELTGWTKLGGFFNAAKKAGLELTRERKDGDTTWKAAPAKAA